MQMTRSVEDLQAEINRHQWWHTIDLGGGITTPGGKSDALMQEEFRNTFDKLDLHGKSVLDIGAWNGGFSIEAKRRGAKRVVGLDLPTPAVETRETFHLATKTIGYDIDRVERNIEHPGALDGLGTFDVILFLGVFYHLTDPVLALRQIYTAVNEVAVVETWVEVSPDPRPLMIFYPGRELSGDETNWWGPNIACVEHLLRMVGFKRVETLQPADHHRIICHAYK